VTLANGLMVGQVALSFLLLMTAAMFVRSIARAYDMDQGSRPLISPFSLPTPGRPDTPSHR
jgi:hypothetical protein